MRHRKGAHLISIHSPHARGDGRVVYATSYTSIFQSTPLMRGETDKWPRKIINPSFQSTPLMRGETAAHGKTFSGL